VVQTRNPKLEKDRKGHRGKAAHLENSGRGRSDDFFTVYDEYAQTSCWRHDRLLSISLPRIDDRQVLENREEFLTPVAFGLVDTAGNPRIAFCIIGDAHREKLFPFTHHARKLSVLRPGLRPRAALVR